MHQSKSGIWFLRLIKATNLAAFSNSHCLHKLCRRALLDCSSLFTKALPEDASSLTSCWFFFHESTLVSVILSTQT
ncbi:hypothetical protein HanXRQr2_Chr12g0539831 [Helianthus annuus]|uniref:Secreted protein n=1 Tax=Helianthus annuus TaxID=4232 RepID=A0A9K3HGA9_HELAN|nr:hypothetical protein HanXRQr2_Chr12g0539831 [Helianthus annuus]KAJ0862561.1 hypothetical protein HanPSC8_Chr12g0519611 [Helianthus annuus]